ncbi:N-acetyl-D-glucosamine kinase [compost metagenome]
MDFWAEALATGLANLVHLLDPGAIVLGGPLAALYPAVSELFNAKLAQKILPGFEVPPLTVAKLGMDGAAIGAAATIRERLFALPELDGTP